MSINEIYRFRTIEELQNLIEKNLEALQKAKKSITNLIAKGIKRDLGCVALMKQDSTFEVVFVKSNDANEKKFSFKSIFSLLTEPRDLGKSQLMII